MEYVWENIGTIPSVEYICGNCGNEIASEKGWLLKSVSNGEIYASINVCHKCNKPTYIRMGYEKVPGSPFGNPVADIKETEVEAIYNEARKAMSVASYTAAVLCCRKLLMHIAVSKGASKNQTFLSYVQYLSENHYIPPDATEWVDHIRAKGNEANHEILIMTQEDAEALITFSEMLLKIIYEFPAAVKRKTAKP